MILVDSDVLIWYMRGNEKARRAIDRRTGFAISVVTGLNFVIHVVQHFWMPQTPHPPKRFASSRAPICRSSIRVRNSEAKSLTRFRKSTRFSAVK